MAMHREHGTDPMAWCSSDVPVVVHQARCVRVRNRHASCSACIDVCPAGALSYGDNVLSVSASRCLACGACSSACPTGAIDLKGAGVDGLYRACAAAVGEGDGRVVIACAGAACADTEKGTVALPCLGIVDESLLMTLAALGAREVVLIHGTCCRSGVAVRVASAADRVRVCLAALNCGACVMTEEVRAPCPLAEESCKERSDEAECREGRAEFRLAKLTPDGVLPQRVPNKRKRLLKAFSLMARQARDSEPLDAGLWARASIDPLACRSCGACAIFCPTGALAKLDGNAVGHTVGTCVGCGCCHDVCPTGAFSLATEVSVGEVAAGVAARLEVPPVEHPNGLPDSIYWRMKRLVGAENMYLR